MPVDIASGTVYLAYEDVAIPGVVDLAWDRRYSTAFLGNSASSLGEAWTCRYFSTLRRGAVEFEFVTPEGATERFDDPEGSVDRGGVVRIPGAFLELRRIGDRYVVQRWSVDSGEVVRFCFAVAPPGESRRLASIEDVTGNGVDLEWDDRGFLRIARQRLERRELVFRYNPGGFLETVTLRTARQEEQVLATYEYTSDGRQVAAYDAAGFADRYEYDEAGRLRREVGKDGGVFTYRYDDQGRCVLTSGLDRYQYKRLQFVEAARVTTVEDSYGATTVYHHLPSGQVVREADPMGGEKTTDYDEYGRIVSTTDAVGSVTTFTYDADGNCATFTDAVGGTYSLTYDEFHLPLSMSDPMGRTWHRVYDERKRLRMSVDPLGGVWRTGYDDAGNAVEMVSPLGAVRRREFAGGILTATTDWAGNVTRVRLDAFGRVTECIGPLGDVTRTRYDALGNIAERVLPGGVTEQFTYDAAGNLVSATDANGQVTRFRYGSCQRLLERVDPDGGVTRFEWGTEPGRLLRVTNGGGETYELFYDAAGRVTHERSYDGSERSFTYDRAGFTSSSTNANGEVVTVVRDALHRVVALELPGGNRLEYAFDPAGYLVAAIDPAIAVTFERDPLGRIVREMQGNEWVESRYDAMNHLSGTSTSLGHVAEWVVDPNGFLTSIRTPDAPTIEWERNAYGQETVRRVQGEVILDQRYDGLGRLVEQLGRPAPSGSRQDTYASAPALRRRPHRTYSYDRLGSPTSVIDDAWGRTDYTYGVTERLLSAMRTPGESEYFAYDAAGNPSRLATPDPNDATQSYAPGGRLVQMGTTRYGYDPEGRRTTKTTNPDTPDERSWHYEWDALDRLVAVRTPTGEVWRYRYDALGRRVEKAGPNGSRRFVWDKDVLIHDVEERGGVATWMFDTHTFAPVATLQNGQLYSVVTDHIGTPRELLSPVGAVVWAMRLQSWGTVGDVTQRSDVSLECPFRFQGQYYDAETALCYNRFRYYSPDEGVYLTRDPLGLAGHNPTLYSYVGNVNLWIDPSGLVCWSTARRNFWKNEAKQNPNQYSAANRARMEQGQAPRMTVQVRDRFGNVQTTDVSLELHHATIPQRVGGANVHNPSNLAIVTPWQHAAVDPHRHTGNTLIGVVTGVDAW